jgi:hypothetical protein
MRGRKRRGRMKGGPTTKIALSNIDVYVTGCRRRDKHAKGDSPTCAPAAECAPLRASMDKELADCKHAAERDKRDQDDA